MSRFDWLPEFLARCEDNNIPVRGDSTHRLAPAHVMDLAPEGWGRMAMVAREQGCRWSALWVEQVDTESLQANVVLELRGDYLLIRTVLPLTALVLPSHTPWFPAANHPERHARDLFGIVFSDHPNHRRWTRHLAWTEDEHPLRHNFPVCPDNTGETLPDSNYPFFQAQGAGVYEIPVGPVHAGIIEPGHFRFQAEGETVLNLELRLGYTHKGIEKIAEGREPGALARLAGRVSGDSTVAHTWAACQAMERAAGVTPPPRALAIRAVLAERERIANHLGDIGAICNDVGFTFAQMQFSRLREDWQRINQSVFEHRLLMDRIVPGGVWHDLGAQCATRLLEQNKTLHGELETLLPILDDHPSLEDRLLGTGVLRTETAITLGVTGYVGKASGVDLDLRRDHAYAPYDRLVIDSPCLQTGDVIARLQVRATDIQNSFALLEQLLSNIPDGPVQAEWRMPADGSEGLGLIEGWRGEIVTHVRFGADGRVARFFPRDPSWLNWPALEQLIHDNIVPDFPVCNKSVNGSYSGHDL